MGQELLQPDKSILVRFESGVQGGLLHVYSHSMVLGGFGEIS
uniref:Uncharacterized protein n=1 Tax=Leptospirillum ferriphilum TaxID=178606 RepID=A0A2I2MHT7_9BACT